jgi:hypothetical protein
MNRDDNCRSRCSQGICSRPVVVQNVTQFGKTSAQGSRLNIHLIEIEKALLAGVSALLFTVAAPCQTTSFASVLPLADTCSALLDELGEIFSRAKLMSLPGVPSRRIQKVFSRTGP